MGLTLLKLLKPTKEEKEECRLITCEFRVSYPHIFKPQAPPGSDKLKYSITMLLNKNLDMTGQSPAGDPRTFQQVIKSAKLAFLGPKANWPKGIISPVNDGDDAKYGDKAGYAGHWAITAKANEDARPSVVGADMSIITDPNVVYPGCYARAYIQAYVNEYMGAIRVLFSLEHVQKIRDGKPFGGRKPVEQVFSPIESGDVAAADEDEDEDMDFRS